MDVRTGQRHLHAELLLEGPQLRGGGHDLVDALAEYALRHDLVLDLLVRLQRGHMAEGQAFSI